jgi:hypothetical protein
MHDDPRENAPSGLPDEDTEAPPMGVEEADPDGEKVKPGPESQPGIPAPTDPPETG